MRCQPEQEVPEAVVEEVAAVVVVAAAAAAVTEVDLSILVLFAQAEALRQPLRQSSPLHCCCRSGCRGPYSNLMYQSRR